MAVRVPAVPVEAVLPAAPVPGSSLSQARSLAGRNASDFGMTVRLLAPADEPEPGACYVRYYGRDGGAGTEGSMHELARDFS